MLVRDIVSQDHRCFLFDHMLLQNQPGAWRSARCLRSCPTFV